MLISNDNKHYVTMHFSELIQMKAAIDEKNPELLKGNGIQFRMIALESFFFLFIYLELMHKKLNRGWKFSLKRPYSPDI